MFAFSHLSPTYGMRPHNFRKYAAVCLINAVRNSLVVRQMRELCVQSALSAPSSFTVPLHLIVLQLRSVPDNLSSWYVVLKLVVKESALPVTHSSGTA